MLICYEQNWCFLHNGRSWWTSVLRSRVSSTSKQRQSRLRAFFLPGRKADKSYPSYMYVNVHLRNSLKINVHSQSTYSLFLCFFFQCKLSLVTTVLSTKYKSQQYYCIANWLSFINHRSEIKVTNWRWHTNMALLSFSVFSFETDAPNFLSCAPKIFSCVPKILAVSLKIYIWYQTQI